MGKFESTIHNLWSTYANELKTFREAKRFTYTLKNVSTLSTENDVNLEVQIKHNDIPLKANGKPRNYYLLIDAYVNFNVISKQNIQIKKYGTKIQYCKKSSEELECIMGYHYDGEHESAPGHPIFHAQIDNNILFDKVQEIESYEIKKSEAHSIQNIRIPTPQMDIFNVMISIMADHFFTDNDEGTKLDTQKTFSALLSKMNTYIKVCGITEDQLFQDGPFKDTCFCPSWYPIRLT